MGTITSISIGHCTLALAVLCLLAVAHRMLFNPLRHVPGPWYSKVTGSWLKLNVLRGRRVHYVHAQHHRYGTIVRISPSEVAVASLSGFREVHRIGGGFLKSPWYQVFSASPEPTIFTMVDPKQHAERRKLFAHGFSATSLRKNWEDAVLQRVLLAVSNIRREAKEGSADVLKWWTLMTTDVIAHLSFGESFHMLERGEKNDYIHALEGELFSSSIRGELPWIHALLRNLPFERIGKPFRLDSYIYQYGSKAVTNAHTQDRSHANLFANMLAQVDEKERNALRDSDVKWEAMSLIIAGSDTTANTLTYLVWAVLKQPDLQRRLEAEVAAVSDAPKDAELEGLPLLNAVADETLRLYGAAPGGLPRIVPPAGAQIDGMFLPAGTTVSTQAFTIHRQPSTFPDPERFNEARFLDKTALSEDQKIAFSPFGAGARICLGIHLARMELRLGAALFFKQCKGARLADNMTDSMMEMENRFLIAPIGHRCDITF